MFTNITIQNFGGIRSGSVPLRPVTVLIGPNGCGKSTILEALFLAECDPVRVALIHQRRSSLRDRVAHQFIRSQSSVEVSADEGEGAGFSFKVLGSDRLPGAGRRGTASFQVWFTPKNGALTANTGGLPLRIGHIVEPAWPSDMRELSVALTSTEKRGTSAISELVRLMQPFVPNVTDFRISDGEPVALGDGWRKPLAILSDGGKRMFGLFAELAEPSQVVLLEEPDSRLNPRATKQLASAIWSAASGGAQVVLSTHSEALAKDLIKLTEYTPHRTEKMIINLLDLDQEGKLQVTPADAETLVYKYDKDR